MNPRFHDKNAFPFVAELERNWRRIHEEYLTVENQLVDWVERDLYGEGWQVFGLYSFPHGYALTPNVDLCPFTTGLIHDIIPRHGAAGFSRLRPGTRIEEHVGFQGDFLRCHLGLDIPEGDCRLLVGGESRAWSNGEAMIFDDRLPHSAWNLTANGRVVLLVDFVP